MSSSIYDQHRKHTKRVGAYAIIKDGAHIASVTIAYPADGAGRLYAYVHVLGFPMLRGSATGYGYDKRSAAVASAVRHHSVTAWPADLFVALNTDDGAGWDRRLSNAGYSVCCIAE